MSAPRFPLAGYLWTLALIGFIGILPLLTTLLAVSIAAANGCTISESVLTPCMIGGSDWGSWLQVGGISVFYTLLTIPFALLAFIVWLVMLILHWRNYRAGIAS